MINLSQPCLSVLLYKEWQKALEDSYQDIIDRNDELIGMTEEYNKHLQDTINKTNEELAQLTELTKKYQELNIKIDTGLNNVTEWESGLVENITNKMNEIIDDYEKKIMKTSQQIQSSRTETTDIRIDPKKADNSINDKSANNISNIGGFDFDN